MNYRILTEDPVIADEYLHKHDDRWSQPESAARKSKQMKHFTIGFKYPRTKNNHGQIFLDGECFANTWQVTGDWFPGKAGWWTINRDGKAFELGFPSDSPLFQTTDEMLNMLEEWLATLRQVNSIG